MLLYKHIARLTHSHSQLNLFNFSVGMQNKNSTHKKMPSVDESWQNDTSEAGLMSQLKRWYTKANTVWSKAECNYDGMLGGYGNLSSADLEFSRTFFQAVQSTLPELKLTSALDCGAGIGRVAKQLLCKTFKTVHIRITEVDIIDQCENFINKAKQILRGSNVRNYYCKGLQQFSFEHSYDCIWIQWVLTHLKDEDVLVFLTKAKKHLNPNGVLIVKENVTSGQSDIDQEDSTIVRNSDQFKALFQSAGFSLIREGDQPHWPKDLYQVHAYALIHLI